MVQAEVVAIGNEVLSGAIINSNAAFISQELLKIGVQVVRHSVFPDDPIALKENLQNALKRTQIVIASGGLGPTCDDVTRQTAAELFESEFHYSEEIAQDLYRRYGDRLIAIQDQATIPTKAIPLMNRVGTAPGSIFESEKGLLILVPGVPSEMRDMIVHSVIPYIKEKFAEINRLFGKTVYLWGVSETQVDPLLRLLLQEYPQIELGIYPREAVVAVSIQIRAETESTADEILNPIVKRIKSNFPKNVYESSSGLLEEAIYDVMTQKKMTLSLAESCTGGAISAALVSISGASEYFAGSLVTYSYEMKEQLLGVSSETLTKYGAVSERTVKEMVQGLLNQTQTDWGVAISGIAGPLGGTPEKPVGTVCCAIQRKGQAPYLWTMKLVGDRRGIIMRATYRVLGELYNRVNGS